MPTWRRRILRFLPLLGLTVADVGSGAVLVSRRRARVDLREFSPGAVLVTAPRRARRHWMEREKQMSSYLAHEHVACLLAMYRVNCVIDVGAYQGEYGKRLRSAGYDGYLVSFEPAPDAFAALERTAADDPKWTVHRHALGRVNGLTSMNVIPGSTLSSILEPTTFGSSRYAQLGRGTRQEVEVRRLDAVLDSVTTHVPDPCLYLKLDTQGYDLEVVAGAGDRIRDFVAMQSEVALLRIYEGMPHMREALAVYEAAGFDITGLYPVSRQRRTARVLEFDCVLVRARSS
jgi:FkbM family methyltransferase